MEGCCKSGPEGVLATYDPDKIMEPVKARIRAEFVGLIPEEAWNSLVKKAVDNFFSKKDAYNQCDKRSDFESLTHGLLVEDVKKRILAFLASPEWTERWDGEKGKNVIGEAVGLIIKDNIREIVAAVLGDAVQGFISQIRNRLSQV